MDLALNNLQRLICHKTQQTKPNQTKPFCTTAVVDMIWQSIPKIYYSISKKI